MLMKKVAPGVKTSFANHDSSFPLIRDLYDWLGEPSVKRAPGRLLASAGNTDIRLIRGYPKIRAGLFPVPSVFDGRV